MRNAITNKNKGAVKNGVKPSSQFFDWLLSEREFALNVVRKWCWDFDPDEPEEVFSILLEGYLMPDARCFREMNRANLLLRLRQVKEDYRKKKEALKRGGGVAHISIDDEEALALEDSGQLSAIQCGEVFEDSEMLLVSLEAELQGRLLIVARALLRWLRGGCLEFSWKEVLTEQERKEFLPRDGSLPTDVDEFVDHALRRALDRIRELLRKKRLSELGGFEG